MPRTDGADDKRWYNLHVRWIYQSMMDTLCPGQVIKCNWFGLEWTELKSISEICFFLQRNSQEQWPSPWHTIFSFIAEFQGCSAQSERHRTTCSAWKQQVMTVGVNSEDAVQSVLWWWPQCLSRLALTSDPAMTRPPDILMIQLLESHVLEWNWDLFRTCWVRPTDLHCCTSPDLP